MFNFGANNFNQADIDPAAEFLTREQDALAGLEDVNVENEIGLHSSGSFQMNNDLNEDEEEEKKKVELREEAKKELTDCYKHHEKSTDKTKSSGRFVLMNEIEDGSIKPGEGV